jgi:hypothetical protein
MKQLNACILLLMVVPFAWAVDNQADPVAQREGIEWTDVWIPGASRADKPHVLLVGDSITKGYYDGVAKALAGRAHMARLATSLCVCDPAYEPTLRAVLAQVQFSVIHFNNGLHGVGYTEEQYRTGYEKALKLIREILPQAKIIVTLSTPLKPGSEKDQLNPRIDQRNLIAKELAAACGASVNDLHSLMKGHGDYYRDPYHYLPKAIAIQVKAVATAVQSQLAH